MLLFKIKTELAAEVKLKHCYKVINKKAKRRVFQATLQSFFRANNERRATQR